jgi:hypothetical protein
VKGETASPRITKKQQWISLLKIVVKGEEIFQTKMKISKGGENR